MRVWYATVPVRHGAMPRRPSPRQVHECNGSPRAKKIPAQRRWRTASGRRLTNFGRTLVSPRPSIPSPVLGLIFLRFAEVRFLTQLAVLEKQAAGGRRGSRVDDPTAYQAEGILYLTPPARFDHILRLPEGSDVGKAVNKAMRDIEGEESATRRRPAKDIPNFQQHAPEESAQEGVGDSRDRRGATRSGGSMSISSVSSLARRVLGAVSSIRRSALFACSSRCWSRFTVGFSTRPAAPAACSSRAPVSWRSTSTVPRLS